MIIRTIKETIEYTLLEEDVNIVDIYTLIFTCENKQYQLTAYYTGEHDTYSIRIYNNFTSELLYSFSMDSCGGGFGDDILETSNSEIDTYLLDKLYGKNGRIIPF